jgi:hypothetical protein
MAELHSCYPSSPSDKRNHLKMIDKLQRKWDEIKESPPALTPPPVARRLLLLLLRTFGWELPDIGSYQEVHHRLIAFLHGEQLRDLNVLASARSRSRCFPTSFQSVFCWSLHRLQWRKRCSRVWATVLPPPQHHQQLSLSQCLNRFRYVPTGACPDFSR